MIKEVSIIVPAEKESNEHFIFNEICKALKKENNHFTSSDFKLKYIKKSIDARHKNIKLYLRYKVYIGEEIPDDSESLPCWKKCSEKKRVIIIGFGPAGIFGALKLLEFGIKPIIIERGADTSKRKRDIAKISTTGIVDEDSNYCFGEGGAGTFSDGKLYTRSNKRGNINKVLNILVHFGADKKILTDAHPHIGTDKLPSIINNIREFILQMGGEILFETKCVDFILDNDGNTKYIKGIIAQNKGTTKEIFADIVLLATGHSASDIYSLLAKCSPQSLEAKTFAMGVRVEHPRSLIDSIQFHGAIQKELGAAEYRLTSQIDSRGVYSFCMCPGGFVVPSSTGPNEIVVNGMSAAGRNSNWSNAAIVVEIRPEDIPLEYCERAKKIGSKNLAGLLFRQSLEQQTYAHGHGQQAPAQRLKNFIEKKESINLPKSSYAPGLISSRLDEWLPKEISSRLTRAFKEFNKSMKGFICDDALLIASETRTSTPVRILRDKESFESCFIKNLFPAGEGSGYAGGIVSSAMDGENAASRIAIKCSK